MPTANLPAIRLIAIAIAITVWALATTATTATAAEPTGLTDQRILDETRVIAISISLPAEDWEAIRNESRDMGAVLRGDLSSPFTWRQADIVIDGVLGGSVGVRK